MKADEHPIDPAVRSRIESSLAAIEHEHEVQILYACESGSRGWGFASPDSDYDVRFLYAHRLPWYLKVDPGRDVIELPISSELDISGWELRKALGLLKRGNATLIEWLDSPVVYRADSLFLDSIRAAASLTHQPERSFHHYLHMARRNYREYLLGDTVRLKKYLYVLRPLLATLWIEQGRGVTPMRFQTLVDTLLDDAALRAAIAELLEIKRSLPETGLGEPRPVVNAFIDSELGRLEALPPPERCSGDLLALDHLLLSTVMRCNGF
jgi:uncharacterized protein